MRIYVDMRSLQDSNYAFRGVGLHGSTLLQEMRKWAPCPIESVGIVDESLPELADCYVPLVDKLQYSRMPRPNMDPSIFVQLSPMTHDHSVFSNFMRRPEIVTATIVYDFIPLYDKRYLPTVAAERAYLGNLAALRQYQSFLAISHTARLDLIKFVDVPEDQIEVTGVSLRREFVAAAFSSDVESSPMSHTGEPYFLLVGGQDERKNTEMAVLSHAALLKRARSVASHFVVAGAYTSDYTKELERRYRDAGGPAGRLHFVRGLSDAALAGLYRGAVAAVCASLNEGFSVPVIEAIACGAPSLASDIAAHRELIEQTEARFDPRDTKSLVSRMERVLLEPDFRERLIAEQRHVAGLFQQSLVGERFWSRVFQEYRLRHMHVPSVHTMRTPRIAVLSPFPPERSGVADYTAHSLRALSKYADIDVYTDAKPVGDHSYVRRFEPISERPYISGEYDRVLSVIGNSHFHTSMIDLHNRYGGACLVHDNRLAELYNWWRGSDRFAAMASKSLGRTVEVAETNHWMLHPGDLPSIFFDELLLRADPLIVHSRGIQSQIRTQYSHNAEYLPFCPYRQFTAEDLDDKARRDARARLRIPHDQIVVITLGFVSHTKAPFECVSAMEALNAWKLPAHLYFVGSPIGIADQLTEQSGELGISERIHLLTDWITDEQYRDYLLAADFAIQLRTHGFGGLSGAVLDCIGAGLPTVANENLADSMESPGYVYRVPDKMSPILIAEQIINGYEAGDHLRRLGNARDNYLREHNFENYAIEMMKVLDLA